MIYFPSTNTPMIFTALSIILFTLIYLFLTFRTQIRIILTRPSIVSPQITELTDPLLTQLVTQKSGIPLERILVVQGDKPYGMMYGITKPLMSLSKNMVDTFTRDELAYVVLHEIAHYKYKHVLKEIIVSILLYLIGLAILILLGDSVIQLPIAILVGFLTGIVNIQYGRVSEIEADTFAANSLDSTAGMISATQKLQVAWSPNYKVESLSHLLFDRGNPYENRVEIARKSTSVTELKAPSA